jgi:S1-C subfamily serine protease
MLHTGLHDDYHRPSDDADKINAEGLKQISQLMFNVLVELADAPSLSGFRRESQNETRFDQQTRERGLPSPPGRLGIRIDGKAAANGQVVVTGVSAGSAAELAGLRAGDRILKFAGEDVTDTATFLVNVLATAGAATATIERPGQEEPLEVTLNLPGEPVRLGISWRADDAEPQTVIINRVVSGSPADLAGLRINERIYRIGGRDFANGEEFRRLVAESKGPIQLDVEGEGRVRTVDVVPSAIRSSGAQDGGDEPARPSGP